jgi:hypothetical protein
MSCTDTTPIQNVSGASTSLTYDSSGICKDAAGGTVATARFEITSSSITTVTVNLSPATGGLDVPTETFSKCSGEGTGNHTRDSYTNASFTMTFPVPPTGDNTWGWDFGDEDMPPKLKIKIRVRRP